MRVRRLMAAGIGLGACGGFVAGLLRSRPDAPWVGWQSAGEPPRYEPMASVRQATPAAGRHDGGPRSTRAAARADAVETRSRIARPARRSRTEKSAPGH